MCLPVENYLSAITLAKSMDLNCNLARTTRLTFSKQECCVRKSRGIPHACYVAIILRFAKEDFKIYFWAKFHLVQGILVRVIAIQSYFSNTPFVQG